MFSEDFKKELSSLLNRHNVDNTCNTPDFILAENLSQHLENYADTHNKRTKWFGESPATLGANLVLPKGKR